MNMEKIIINLDKMSAEDRYFTIASPSEGLFKDRGSKFLAFAYPFTNEAELKPIIEQLKKEHFKAVHLCFAYRLGIDSSQFRVNDDGEPSGSAGKPILNVLLSHQLNNILVVVVRYFGGTLLGVPGLINAYKSATIEAISHAQIIEKTLNDIYEIAFEFILMNDVMKIVKEFNIKINNQLYDNRCIFVLEFRKSIAAIILGKLTKIDALSINYIDTV